MDPAQIPQQPPEEFSITMADEANGLTGDLKRKHSSLTSSDLLPKCIEGEPRQRKLVKVGSSEAFKKGVEANFSNYESDGSDELDYELPDERQEITQDLESGSHVLLLEVKTQSPPKCRADKCLVEKHARQGNDRINSRYRINLEAKQHDTRHWSQQSKPNRRFFHISCLESIGVDVAQYLTLSKVTFVDGFPVRANFHPAIVDWVTQKGKAFDAALYGDYEKALDEYRRACDCAGFVHRRSCSETCVCGMPTEPPKSSDFIQGEPTQRTLTNVLIHIAEADHLEPMRVGNGVAFAEGVATVAPAYTKTALAAAEAKKAKKDADGESKTLEATAATGQLEKDDLPNNKELPAETELPKEAGQPKTNTQDKENELPKEVDQPRTNVPDKENEPPDEDRNATAGQGQDIIEVQGS